MANMRIQWEERYQAADLPWDSGITPPEVVAFWQSELGRDLPQVANVLDIGCGTGTNLAYLAKLGHYAAGIELSGNALTIAAERHHALSAALRRRISMIHGSAASLPFCEANFDYILDIGCLHGIPVAHRLGYAEGVVANLRSGGFYHLYGFDRVEATTEADAAAQADEASAGRGLGTDEVETLLGPSMSVVAIVQAEPNPNPCRWYLFRKTG